MKFLTVAEVAAVMRVSKMTVYRLVHSGELPAVRVGRSFRVPEDAVNEYLREELLPDRLRLAWPRPQAYRTTRRAAPQAAGRLFVCRTTGVHCGSSSGSHRPGSR